MADSKKVNDIVAGAQTIDPNDPDLMEKLTMIAQQVAAAQGKKVTTNKVSDVDSDPMDELGCEGCQ